MTEYGDLRLNDRAQKRDDPACLDSWRLCAIPRSTMSNVLDLKIRRRGHRDSHVLDRAIKLKVSADDLAEYEHIAKAAGVSAPDLMAAALGHALEAWWGPEIERKIAMARWILRRSAD